MNLEACLPAHLRGGTATITKIAAGLSGAGIYRVERNGEAFVLKVVGRDVPLDAWRNKLHFQQLAAQAGVAPRIVHVDEARRAVLSIFVTDQSFPAFYGNPNTHEAALIQLAQMLRQVHKLPLPPAQHSADPRDFLASIWLGLGGTFALPTFASDAVRDILTAEAPIRERGLVLSHNDVNPTNLIYDGNNPLLLDWEVAGPNDPFYDLATISVFLRMEERTCQKLLAAYDNALISPLPARFTYNRRLAAVLCGTMFLNLARQQGYAGATGAETLDNTNSLGEFYQRIQSGELSLATGQGQWGFGLALIKESLAYR